jgi:DNA-binding transcriptional MerR regulator
MAQEGKEEYLLTIGKLVRKLKKDYPDITPSKLRFLESKGLVIPGRGVNNYRVYGPEDIKKIEFILRMQREFFMPLEVIKEKIDSLDLEEENSDMIKKEMQLRLGVEDKTYKKKLTIDDVKEKYKLSQEYINDLLENEIISWREENGKYIIDGRDLEIIKIVSNLIRYGIQVRHLKLFENTAHRYALFIQQIVYPLLKAAKSESHKKASAALYQLEEYFCQLHSLLMKKENKAFLDKNK